MQAKHCQQCGKLIPMNAVFCQFCGAKQYTVKNSTQKSHTQPQRPAGKPGFHMDQASLTRTDWGMLIVNGLSALMQFLYSAQTILMPLSKSDLEFDFCTVIALTGVVVSGLDAYECYKNCLPIWASVLGVAGDLLGIACAALFYTDVMMIVGTVVLGFSFWLIYYQLHHLYRK